MPAWQAPPTSAINATEATIATFDIISSSTDDDSFANTVNVTTKAATKKETQLIDPSKRCSIV